MLDKWDVTKLFILTEHGFLDAAAEKHFNDAFEDFKRRTPADKTMKFEVQHSMQGLVRRLLAHRDKVPGPWWLTPRFYTIASLLGCSVPYRIALDWRAATHQHTIKTLLGQ